MPTFVTAYINLFFNGAAQKCMVIHVHKKT